MSYSQTTVELNQDQKKKVSNVGLTTSRAPSSAWSDAKRMFEGYTGYTHPLSFEEWDQLPKDHQAAVLYLQFYDAITLAWFKVKSVYSTDEDGVSEILQYLQKHVNKNFIHDDPRRFCAKYIYRVAYNCLYCLCRDPNLHKRVYENEVSNLHRYGDVELDWFDVAVDPSISQEDKIRDNTNTVVDIDGAKKAFWDLIESQDETVRVFVAKMLDDNLDGNKLDSCCVPEDLRKFNEAHRIWELGGKVGREPQLTDTHKGGKTFGIRAQKKLTPEKEEEAKELLQDLLAEFYPIFVN